MNTATGSLRCIRCEMGAAACNCRREDGKWTARWMACPLPPTLRRREERLLASLDAYREGFYPS